MTLLDRSATERRVPDGHLALPVPGGFVPVHRRGLLVGGVTALGILVLALLALCLGDYPLSLPEVTAALFSDQGFASRIVVEWRLPRIVAAIVFGAALGASGALFQTLTRNPLGSPDVIGFSTGAYTGAILVITLAGGSVITVSIGALAGGLMTALVVYMLAWRNGVQGFRLIIVGIAVTAILSSLNTYLLLRAQTEVAMTASIWGAGSLSLVGWDDVGVAIGPLAVLLVLTLLVSGPLRQLELGDDAARAHGVRTERTRLLVMVVGVALIAIVTAVSGPIAFIALAAPQIARRLTSGAGIPIGTSAMVAAFLLLAADAIAQHVVPGSVPVGIVTVVIGGVYLVTLLVHEARKQL
ncbi:iron chelate uptake ABC transporter family permease subunit [Microbacterium sp. kSW2-24]|uniref:FecCD family ABC transporter permease n=1 Tax=Microbacterium galbinum TaxID=2851646 RepID=UPI001FFCE5F9|nr:iron chelate uptake ABC transporter family permease subunit [Microbacterium galbinum]MCK2022105.1 iron chelate uptake ABC transporter family permease subunit [Microbacterium galbinum]